MAYYNKCISLLDGQRGFVSKQHQEISDNNAPYKRNQRIPNFLEKHSKLIKLKKT